MQKKYIKYTILLIFFILITSLFIYIYYHYELPNKNNLKNEFSNLSIIARYNGKNIETGYIIQTVDGNIKGNTSKSYQLEKVRIGQIVNVNNVNIDDQTFYQDNIKINTSNGNARVVLDLKAPYPINIDYSSTNPIQVKINSKDAKYIVFCLDWSLNYIFVKPNNYPNIENPKGYENWPNCYDAQFSLEGEEKILNIDYSEFSDIKEEDFIKIAILQKDFIGKNDIIMEIR